jgi:hypothetical protein
VGGGVRRWVFGRFPLALVDGEGGGGQALVLAAPLVVGEVDGESIQMLVLAAPGGAKC